MAAKKNKVKKSAKVKLVIPMNKFDKDLILDAARRSGYNGQKRLTEVLWARMLLIAAAGSRRHSLELERIRKEQLSNGGMSMKQATDYRALMIDLANEAMKKTDINRLYELFGKLLDAPLAEK